MLSFTTYHNNTTYHNKKRKYYYPFYHSNQRKKPSGHCFINYRVAVNKEGIILST